MTIVVVVKFDRIFISNDKQDTTFIWMKSHFPYSFLHCKFVKRWLHMLYINSVYIATYAMVSYGAALADRISYI
jgi:hypothetical protein